LDRSGRPRVSPRFAIVLRRTADCGLGASPVRLADEGVLAFLDTIETPIPALTRLDPHLSPSRRRRGWGLRRPATLRRPYRGPSIGDLAVGRRGEERAMLCAIPKEPPYPWCAPRRVSSGSPHKPNSRIESGSPATRLSRLAATWPRDRSPRADRQPRRPAPRRLLSSPQRPPLLPALRRC